VQARELGERLAARALRPAAIRSSRWCRCLHTGQGVALGLGGAALPVVPWPALDSFFEERSREPAQTALLLERLRTLRPPGFELWVTHQVNISALTGLGASMGQALWLRVAADGSIKAARWA
jgi:broad specificity phosphatase PhoE